MASLHFRKSDGRWIARLHTDTGYRYVTGKDRDEVVRRAQALDPSLIPPEPRTISPLEERFWAKVITGPNCWLWIGSLGGWKGGYGQFRVGAGLVRAHRFAYEASGGTIPDGMELDHLCRNTWCVRPEHMEPVTPLENKRRRLRSGRHRQPLSA